MDLINLTQDALSHVWTHRALPPTDLLRALLSKGLGYGIVAFAGVVKLPQILALARSKSAAGLAPVSAELEQVAYAIAVRRKWREEKGASGSSLLGKQHARKKAKSSLLRARV